MVACDDLVNFLEVKLLFVLVKKGFEFFNKVFKGVNNCPYVKILAVEKLVNEPQTNEGVQNERVFKRVCSSIHKFRIL